MDNEILLPRMSILTERIGSQTSASLPVALAPLPAFFGPTNCTLGTSSVEGQTSFWLRTTAVEELPHNRFIKRLSQSLE